ncbi:hypothetical protein AVEN_81327-1 [Araneus ventricosus]|uniref:Uncharacterized protein n=1 Tax=Araneus ventricosus TaxID=182803 RepID=A0A4Y2B6P6_ARAVE|nr:hypothetical protein AVEN_81327-1 [Araneus ventricosus]
MKRAALAPYILILAQSDTSHNLSKFIPVLPWYSGSLNDSRCNSSSTEVGVLAAIIGHGSILLEGGTHYHCFIAEVLLLAHFDSPALERQRGNWLTIQIQTSFVVDQELRFGFRKYSVRHKTRRKKRDKVIDHVYGLSFLGFMDRSRTLMRANAGSIDRSIDI